MLLVLLLLLVRRRSIVCTIFVLGNTTSEQLIFPSYSLLTGCQFNEMTSHAQLQPHCVVMYAHGSVYVWVVDTVTRTTESDVKQKKKWKQHNFYTDTQQIQNRSKERKIDKPEKHWKSSFASYRSTYCRFTSFHSFKVFVSLSFSRYNEALRWYTNKIYKQSANWQQSAVNDRAVITADSNRTGIAWYIWAKQKEKQNCAVCLVSK